MESLYTGDTDNDSDMDIEPKPSTSGVASKSLAQKQSTVSDTPMASTSGVVRR